MGARALGAFENDCSLDWINADVSMVTLTLNAEIIEQFEAALGEFRLVEEVLAVND